jgi:hypothetical protein
MSWHDWGMTNTDDLTAAIIESNARRLAQIQRDRELFANPIMPAKVNRPAPRRRRNSVKHRAIR